jgi:hypothetical protein
LKQRRPDPEIAPALTRYLDDLEARIDPQVEEQLLQAWRVFAAGDFTGEVFSPARPRACPPKVAWPKVTVNAALGDYDSMALQQYLGCSQVLEHGGGELLNVRCNYGTSILPSLFGVELFIMDADLDTLPTSRPLNDPQAVKRLVAAGLPDLQGGYGRQVFEMAGRFLAIGRKYPNIGRYVHIYHPDLQGPMDICEVIWGSSIFYALHDQPGLVKALLELVTETYRAFMHAWMACVPSQPDGLREESFQAHWGFLHRGNLMLRDDSAMNLSPAMFREFIRPYDQRLLDEFGGGAIHFCGRGDHFVAEMSEMAGVYAINLSQPELNDMNTVFAYTVDRGINLLGLAREAAAAALAEGRHLHGRVHVPA